MGPAHLGRPTLHEQEHPLTGQALSMARPSPATIAVVVAPRIRSYDRVLSARRSATRSCRADRIREKSGPGAAGPAATCRPAS